MNRPTRTIVLRVPLPGGQFCPDGPDATGRYHRLDAIAPVSADELVPRSGPRHGLRRNVAISDAQPADFVNDIVIYGVHPVPTDVCIVGSSGSTSFVRWVTP
jgi:hypothetical protein